MKWGRGECLLPKGLTRLVSIAESYLTFCIVNHIAALMCFACYELGSLHASLMESFVEMCISLMLLENKSYIGVRGRVLSRYPAPHPRGRSGMVQDKPG